MANQSKQYTVRSVPLHVDRALRRKARLEGKSLNQTALEALAAGSGVAEEPVLYRDLDPLAGSWIEDEAFDAALAALDQIDPELWR
jgi:hypothetical protein